MKSWLNGYYCLRLMGISKAYPGSDSGNLQAFPVGLRDLAKPSSGLCVNADCPGSTDGDAASHPDVY